MKPDFTGKQPWEYFDSRIRNAAALTRFVQYETLSLETLAAALAEPVEPGEPGEPRDATVPPVMYVHIPFCTQACAFCGYTRCIPGSDEMVERFVENVERQVDWLSGCPWAQSVTFGAVFFGGGTPTALPFARLARLVNHIVASFRFAPDAEITLETTVSDWDDEYAHGLAATAVNRVSVGIQSFDTQIRRSSSRRNDGRGVSDMLASLRSTGIERLAGDLMYNLDGQSADTMRADVAGVAANGLTGCSLYALLPFPDAPLVKSGQYREPDHKTEYRLFRAAHDALVALPGWKALSAVQYGSPPADSAVYVTSHSSSSDVLAIGPGAMGTIGGVRYRHAADIGAASAGLPFVHESMRVYRPAGAVTGMDRLLRLFRLGTTDAATFDGRLGGSPLGAALVDSGLVARTDNEVTLNADGRFWAANLAALALQAEA